MQDRKDFLKSPNFGISSKRKMFLLDFNAVSFGITHSPEDRDLIAFFNPL